ncbi:MAG TPA: hypothetical protein VLD37_00440 [Candidatus Bilamarchaeum sp.]|nr:hypothetical protein [Candidatus Bilamarchaeum sp.]
METKPLEKRKAGIKLRKLLSGAVLAATIFTGARANADPPPRPAQEGVSLLAGARLSSSPGISFEPFSQTIRYSALSYGLGDEDFSLRYGGRDVPVIDYVRNFDFSDFAKLPELLDFGRGLRESLAVRGPGTYHRELHGSLEAFAEGYSRAVGTAGGRGYTTELGLSGYAYATGRASMDLTLDYDNWSLPLYLNSDFRSSFSAHMHSRTEAGIAAAPSGNGIGFGVSARRFNAFDSEGTLRSHLEAGLFSGFSADAETDVWRRRLHGYSFLPYLTLSLHQGNVRLGMNAGLDVRHEEESFSHDYHHVSKDSVSGEGESSALSDEHSETRLLAVPVLSSTVLFPENGNVFTVLSFSTRDGFTGRGALGVRSGRLLASGSLATNLQAGTELFVVLSGNPGSGDFSNYLFEAESARSSFFPAFRSRIMRSRQAFITSSDSVMLRGSLDYDPRFNEAGGEGGVILSRRRFFIDSGIRVSGGENVAAGFYNSVGTAGFFTTQSYSSTLPGAGPPVQTVLFSVGGFMP